MHRYREEMSHRHEAEQKVREMKELFQREKEESVSIYLHIYIYMYIKSVSLFLPTPMFLSQPLSLPPSHFSHP